MSRFVNSYGMPHERSESAESGRRGNLGGWGKPSPHRDCFASLAKTEGDGLLRLPPAAEWSRNDNFKLPPGWGFLFVADSEKCH